MEWMMSWITRIFDAAKEYPIALGITVAVLLIAAAVFGVEPVWELITGEPQ